MAGRSRGEAFEVDESTVAAEFPEQDLDAIEIERLAGGEPPVLGAVGGPEHLCRGHRPRLTHVDVILGEVLPVGADPTGGTRGGLRR